MTIGEVARRASVTPDTIRYYERVGLLPKPPRTAAGYRQYGTGIVHRLAVVRNAQRFGFSLNEIAGFLRVRDAGGKPCHDVRAGAQRLLQAVDQQIAALTRARREMRRTLRTWDRKLAATPPNELAHLLTAGRRRAQWSIRRAP
jgi:DNA-binding transcriptional MerR regulator